jgi:putative membrane protein
MSHKKICTIALASIAIVAAGSAFGQGNTPTNPTDTANPGQTTQGARSTSNVGQTAPDTNVGRSADDTFAMHAASGGMAEVKLGQLAQKNASSEAVKSFGKRMVDDHSKANDQLKAVAASNNITLPTTMNTSDRATYNRLAKLTGAEFDKAYMNDMVMDHEKDISEFKREANAGKKEEIKSFAAQTLPTLESHLKEAKSVDSQVGGANTGN